MPNRIDPNYVGWAWCVHHEIHVEWCTNAGERSAYIDAYKPPKERDRRHAEFQPVLHPERLPARLVEAWRAYDEAWRACDEARRACGEAGWAYDEAWCAYEPELMALHREEYPETKWNGRTIFSERTP